MCGTEDDDDFDITPRSSSSYCPIGTFGLVFSVSTEHKRGPRTSHIQIWAYSPPHPHQNYYYRCRCRCALWSYSDHVAQRFQFVCRFIKFFTPFSLLTLLSCIDCPRNFSISHRRSEVNDIVYLMIDEKDVILIYDYGLEASFSERIRQTLR